MSSETIVIRAASPADAEAVVEAQLRMARETEDLELDPSVVARGVQAVLEDASKGRYYVAEIAGTVAGTLLTTYEWSDWRNGTILWIQSVYVWPEHRRSGVFRALYGHLRGRVETAPDLLGLRLYVERSNTVAHRVYEAMGMRSDHYVTYEWLR